MLIIDCLKNPAIAVKTAVKALSDGEVMIVPTETVYGLAAGLNNKAAVSKIFELKIRDGGKPLQVLIPDISWVERLAEDVSPSAYDLMKKEWPGPLTAVLRKKGTIPDLVTAGKPTVGLRVPENDFLLSVLREFGPVAASSANLSGQDPALTAEKAAEYFPGKIRYCFDGGECRIGKASSVIDLTGREPVRLR